MEISLSVSTVFGIARSIGIMDVIQRGVTWVLFSQAYRISTLYYNLRNHLGRSPEDIADYFEYDIYWQPYHLNKRINAPQFWIKAKEERKFSRVLICITAENKKIRYQNSFPIYNLGAVPVEVSLTSVPFRNLGFDYEKSIVYTPYDKFITEIVEIKGENGEDIPVPYPTKDYFHPFDRLEVHMGCERGFVEKWDEVFNLQYLEMQINEIKIELIGYSLNPFVRSMRRAIFGYRIIAKVVFWKRNLVRARQITEELGKYLKEDKELMA
ncbi:hypothetical protein [Chromobacterium vaccinii]|uniref:hypothetical protein n=1 Tax=Chromobacterium vaccinii TaxID=1108595 RepID=UPI001E4D3C4A|nr:hypothetical protein [Chromobacterium vaccinii]MCD4500240.1 hypothetical protein [Chromobacterium vaccinii]